MSHSSARVAGSDALTIFASCLHNPDSASAVRRYLRMLHPM
ncbi:MAG: hypothetical protein AVDCRST_MAG67-2560 [uncultured Solirubrobacteraceae bacterium]|uniref:Uncharacterized protein n=1 Tax=uncultured Solirubrobacteraceae bacterium TaxID=1162706 RepID=A0A6J4SXQ3_9ACTN|nr:MAG: hypothetical protein AVDCRST_MAG67-2560 [uncultured Solirubrobacteraceae bacterium]